MGLQRVGHDWATGLNWYIKMGLPWGSSGRGSACNARNVGDEGSVPGSRRFFFFFNHREQACGGQEGGWVGEGCTGSLGYKMETFMYRMDKQKSITV